MRSLIVPLVILILASCGPETVRATGAPVTTQRVVATASPSRTAAITTAPATTSSGAPSTNTGPATTAPRTTAPATTSVPTAGATAAPAGSPVLGSCASEALLRPQTPGATLPIVFSNQSGARRDVSSLDANGRRVAVRALAAGESFTQTVRSGEMWVVADASGACVAIQTAVAPALVILSASRVSLVPLYAIRGRVTEARSGNALPGQTVFIWTPDESACAIIGGAGSPGYVVSSITAPDGTYGVYVTGGDYKIRVRTAPIGGGTYAPQWWRGKPASTAGQCAAADVLTVSADAAAVDFMLQPE